jgi:tetratricopeptide (TPR) repeat protein
LIESSLGRLRSTRGKPGQGRDLVVHAAAVLQAHDAEVSPSRVIEALMTLGDSYVTSGQLEAAVEPLEDGMARLRQHPEVETPEGVPEMLYTRFLIDRGEFAKAVELLQRVRARAAAAFGADDPYVSDIELRIGVVHIHTGRLEEAESVFLKIMHDADLREDDFGSPKHQAQLNLAAVRMEQRRFEEAAPAILAMYRKMSAQPPLERNVRLEIVTNVRMGQLLTGLGRAAEARQHFERALALAADLDPASPLVAQTRGRFALCLIDLHDRPAAETQLRLAERAFAAQPVVSGFFKRPMVEARRRLADSGGRWPPMGHS